MTTGHGKDSSPDGDMTVEEQGAKLREVLLPLGAWDDISEISQEITEPFGTSPLSQELIEAALVEQRDIIVGALVDRLAQAGRREIEPWVRDLLNSDNLIFCGYAAIAMLSINVEEGIRECLRVYEYGLSINGRTPGFDTRWIIDALEDSQDPNAQREAQKLYERPYLSR